VSDHPVGTHAATGPATPTRVGGRYVLRGVLGRGGMATVHRARDEVLDRDVAVKLLHAHLATDPAFLDRFRREARAAAALSHPNVVAVHDWGETDEGPFLVLQLIDGPSLRGVLRHRRRLHAEEAVSVLGPAAAGLGCRARRRAGAPRRQAGEPAARAGRHGTGDRFRTRPRGRVGDHDLRLRRHRRQPPLPLARGGARASRSIPAPTCTALGVVLYETLVGRPPFEGDSPLATALQHTANRVPPPSTVVPGVPPALDEVVRRATDPDRDGRYADAAAFGAALTAASPPAAAPLPALFAEDITVGTDRPRNGTAVLGPEAHDTTVPGDPADDRPSVAWDAEGAQLWPPPVAPPPPPPPPPPADGLDPHDGHDPVGWLEEDHGPYGEAAELRSDPAATGGHRVDREGDHLVEGGRRRWPLALLLILALLAASAVGGYLLWDRVLAPIVPIPAVAEAPVGSAVDALEQAGFAVRVDDDRPHSLEVPADHVLDQRPVGEARQGATVTLVVSAGPRQVTVPDTTGGTAEDAEEALLGADLTVGDVTEAFHEDVPSGRVVSSVPSPGDEVDEATSVDLVLSRGPAPREVPDLRSLTLSEAQEALREVGLDGEVTGRTYSDVPEGQVVAHSPGRGNEVERGTTIGLTLSDGPEPLEVPNVRGQLRDEAVETLEDLGFEVDIETRGGVGAFLNPGRVFEQDPGPGAELLPGDEVLLYVYER
jgi:eukaryotic-like serine/threonine-protein kinase